MTVDEIIIFTLAIATGFLLQKYITHRRTIKALEKSLEFYRSSALLDLLKFGANMFAWDRLLSLSNKRRGKGETKNT